MFLQFNRFVASAFSTGINNDPEIARSLLFTSAFKKKPFHTAALSGLYYNFPYCLTLMKARGQDHRVRWWEKKPNSPVDFCHNIKTKSHL